MEIAARQLNSIMPNANAGRWLAHLNGSMNEFEINNSMRAAMFLAQIAVESGELNVLVESLNYSAERMMAVWPRRFPSLDLALAYARNPEKLGNLVYANRLGNGPPETGDGFRYRGRGLIQATGKAHYQEASAALHRNFVDHPEELEEPESAAREAAWWWRHQGLNAIADSGKFEECTRRINGGLTGFDARTSYWRKALPVLGASNPDPQSRDLCQRIQAALNARGADPPLAVDGIWGPMCEAAADRFRAHAGLNAADGIDLELRRALGV
jgi:putative chitinase